MQEQLSLIDDFEQVRCINCGAMILTLSELRSPCEANTDPFLVNHQVTGPSHGLLYRRDARKQIEATYAGLL